LPIALLLPVQVHPVHSSDTAINQLSAPLSGNVVLSKRQQKFSEQRHCGQRVNRHRSDLALALN